MTQTQFLRVLLRVQSTDYYAVYAFPRWIMVATWIPWKLVDAGIKAEVKHAVKTLVDEDE